MSATMSYIKQMAAMFPEANKQGDYYRWLAKIAKPIKTTSYKNVDNKNIEHFIETHEIKLKQCYDNSFWLAFSTDCLYSEGMINVHGLGIEHAWNSYKGVHFDLTQEIPLAKYLKDNTKNNPQSYDYVHFITLTESELMEFSTALGFSGPFIKAYYFKNVLGEWDAKTIKRLRAMWSD